MSVSDADLDDGVVNAADLEGYFGPAYGQVRRFHDLLRDEGELRGLIGPREVPRLWVRHLLNSAAVVPYLPVEGTIADVGSGAGLPGIVVAAMRPRARLLLIEPMERRCAWLAYATGEIGLDNVDVIRGRAEECSGTIVCDAVTSRAVAPLDKLVRICLPLVKPGGAMVALKGRDVAKEADRAAGAIRKARGITPEIFDATTLEGVGTTKIVRIARRAQ